MNQEQMWDIIEAHGDLIGAVSYKTAAKHAPVSKADAEDYKSKAIVSLASGRLVKWDPTKGRSLKSWIALITEQSVINELYKRRVLIHINHTDVDGSIGENGLTLPETDNPLAKLLRSEKDRRLTIALDKLDDDQHKLFSAICNETINELGLTPVQLCRARKRLIKRIQELL